MDARQKHEERQARRNKERQELMERQHQVQLDYEQDTKRRQKMEEKELLQRSLNVTSETEKTGAETLTKLRTQRDQLNRVRSDLDEIDDTLSNTELIIARMKSWFCFSACMSNAPAEKTADEKRVRRMNEQEAHDRNEAAAAEAFTEQQGIRRAAADNGDDADSDVSAFDGLDHGITNLNQMANQMNGEVRLHNNMIADMNGDMDRIDDKYTKQNKDLRKLAG